MMLSSYLDIGILLFLIGLLIQCTNFDISGMVTLVICEICPDEQMNEWF